MSFDEIFKLIDRWGKLVSLLTAIGGLVGILAGNDIIAYFLIFITCLLLEFWLAGILRQPKTLYTDRQRRTAQWIIVLVVIAAVGGIGWWLWTITSRTSIQVFSAPYPFANTGINVNAGDQLEITVADQSATWDCGRGKNATPEGYPGEQYGDTVYPQANPCALIGLISSASPDVYFLVGYRTTFTTKESGYLYLGCNDSKDRFGDNPTDSKLEVEIVVVKRLNIIPIILAFIVLVLAGIALVPKFRQRIFPPDPTANTNARVEGSA
jgi:hypothetical protein